MKTSLLRARPHLWYQLYWVVYLIWFFWLDLTVTDPNYIVHSPLDDFIPFNEWFIFPYGSWFFLLAGVTALLWWFDTASYDKLCLMMFSGMTFCLILYMVLPNGLDIRPTVEEGVLVNQNDLSENDVKELKSLLSQNLKEETL